MKITLRIQRFNPETDREPHDEDFEVPAEPTDRILDALMYVNRHLDGSLAFRKSCAHGVCGSDAMLINGEERLACKTLVQDVVQDGKTLVTVAPLRAMAVQRDLMVDQARFFESYRAVKPFFMAKEEAAEGEHRQSPAERARFDDATKCILCASCYSSCPVVHDTNPEFIGPAAVVQAARFNFDSRDDGFSERLPALDNPNGAWACENHFNCTKVCPREIKVTKNINLTKRAIKKHKESDHQDS
jgi:succinate dehydrogenase / fumarate reductase iron-sulfur subunit